MCSILCSISTKLSSHVLAMDTYLSSCCILLCPAVFMVAFLRTKHGLHIACIILLFVRRVSLNIPQSDGKSVRYFSFGFRAYNILH